MNNVRIRTAMFESGLKHWQVAEHMNVADETFSRWLRHELPEEKQKQILKAIEELKNRG